MWQPNLIGKPGSHFFAKYRIKGASQWIQTPPEMQEDFIVVRALEPEAVYEFVAVAVDGEYNTESHTQDVDTYGVGKFIHPLPID